MQISFLWCFVVLEFAVDLTTLFRILENLVYSQAQKAEVILVTAHSSVSVHDPK